MKFLSAMLIICASTLTFAADCQDFEGRYQCADGKILEVSHLSKKQRLLIRTEKNDNFLDNTYSTKKLKRVLSEENGSYTDNDGLRGHAICKANEVEIITEDFFTGDLSTTYLSKTDEGLKVRTLFDKVDCKSF